MKKYKVTFRYRIRSSSPYGIDTFGVDEKIVKANTFAEARSKVKESDIKILDVKEMKE